MTPCAYAWHEVSRDFKCELAYTCSFDYVNVDLLSTIISQIGHFLFVENKNVAKLTNEIDIKSTGFQ